MKNLSTRFLADAILIIFQSINSFALTDADFKKKFADRDGCFLISDLKTEKIISEYNSKRCQERFSPCSTFKIAAALMTFEKKVLKDENQVIKWAKRPFMDFWRHFHTEIRTSADLD